MIVSSSGVLGRGTKAQLLARKNHSLPAQTDDVDPKSSKLAMNFIGQVLANRLVHFIIPKGYYARHKRVWVAMMQEYANDASGLQDRGFKDCRGKRWHLCFVGNLGDMPQQVKTGGLKRSFNNVPKKATSMSVCKGICHLCPAGQPGFDWENMSLDANFFCHMHEDEPFDSEAGVFTLVRMVRKQAKVLRNDIWHGFHLGLGMIFVSSGLVESLSLMEGRSVQSRIESMNGKLIAFQLASGRWTLSFDELTKERLGWPKIRSFPKGGWQKASDTPQLMKFLIHILQDVEDESSILFSVKRAAKAIDFAFSALYQEGIFVFGDRAHDIAAAGLNFLDLNMKVAAQSHAEGKNLFLQMPKLHSVHHVFASMSLGLLRDPQI